MMQFWGWNQFESKYQSLSQCGAQFAQVTIIRFDEQTLSSISTLQVQLLLRPFENLNSSIQN